MNNLFTLTARIAVCSPLRYTPAGIPVLELVLIHESSQQENGQACQIRLEMAAKIIGKEALRWQHREQTLVEASGFMASKSQRYPKPVLRIQNIQEYKG